MNKILMGFAASALLLVASPSFADDRDFDLVNATGYPIGKVYIDESASDAWSENMLPAVMQDGEMVHMKFGKGDKGCKWDMKISWTDGSPDVVWSGFDLCTINKITLKWDRATNTTSAIKE